MAATDQPYRSQRILDVVFGVTCVLMLVSIIGMFAQDYNRDWKKEQRLFQDVDEALSDRAALRALPDPDDIHNAEAKVTEACKELSEGEKKAELDKIEAEIKDALPDKVRKEARYQGVKADYDSIVSLYNIAVDENPESARTTELRNQVEHLRGELVARQGDLENAETRLNDLQKRKAELQRPLTKALADLKKLNDDFDRIARNAAQKRWGLGATIRTMPVLDAFASPTKIQQFTLDELPIDYSFKRVTRFDRCMTCHQGMERANFSREALAGLKEITKEQQDKLDRAQEVVRNREKVIAGTGEKLPYSASDLRLRTVDLSPARVSEFCAHPRLDLFVDGNSPHPAEKFGCTSCHSGQGSATSFDMASHTPTSAEEKKRWVKEHDWEANHFWDYPMMPRRFTESGCLKCHYQVSELIREGNKNEAPKLVEGFNIIRRAGCFGCHEIAGIKGSRAVGPDLRLEPSPALETLTPAEQAKMLSDPLNPPGTMRKVGPNLRRIVEKTNPEWVVKWIRAPRDFRPTTWMPHFYGLTNNSPVFLKGTGQEKFPDAEIHSIAFYLFQKSKLYLEGKDPYRQANLARKEYLEGLQKGGLMSEKDQRELEDINHRLERATPPVPLEKQITDETGTVVQLPPAAKDDKARQESETRGRMLFSERGCLACHRHPGTTVAGQGVPAVTSKADFGPELSRLAIKLGTKPGDKESARRWLVQWVLNPTVYHPRTFMPITHVNVEQANDIANWLLSQQAEWTGPEVPPPDEDTLKSIARVYLEKVTTRREVDNLLNPRDDEAKKQAADWLKDRRPESDEIELTPGVNADTLKLYVGRKAINLLGCFGCHEIPGFEASKPIGTPLNDWGKKDPERLAFEDIKSYADGHYHVVDNLSDAEGKPAAFEGDKPPYEAFFYDALVHHQREGFLHQKLREPRSYDYNRMRAWDERLRMPQFKFAKIERNPDESDEDFRARAERAEAEAREKVMTFILGLVAEPVPPKYVYAPFPERSAEVRGRLVLDKYNCGGCHQVKPGIYEFKKTPATQEALEGFYQAASQNFPSDHRFPNHTAWAGLTSTQGDRFTAFGVPGPEQPENTLLLRLTDALRFQDSKKETRDIPAGSSIGFGADQGFIHPEDVISRSEPLGGTFSELLVPYLQAKDKQNYGEYKTARAALPPPLFREGEKVQPDWLFRFLRNPFAIRPVTVLRMPRFNMSDEEAMALVNYFAASDKINNPGESLNYPYMTVPQRDEHFWEEKTKEYVERLGKQKVEERLKALQPTWEQVLRDRVSEADRNLKGAEEALNAAKGDARAAAEKNRDALRKELDQLKSQADKKDYKALEQQWLQKEAYASDSYRLLANYNICLNCHQVGPIPPKGAQGPSLNLAWERLRPEWTMRWIANPDRLISYPTPMPQNFGADKPPWPEVAGTMRQQVEATRDVLMILPRAAEMPANKYYTPPAGGEGAK